MRPLLLPALRRLWRDHSTLQLGLDPARAVLLCDLPPGAHVLLDRFDGTTDLAEILGVAEDDGLSRDDLTHLMGMLVGAGVVVDAAAGTPLPAALDVGARHRLAADAASLSLLHGDAGGVLARRHDCMVAVHGQARLAVPLASTLAAAGVGRVHVVGRGVVEQRDVAPGGLSTSDVSQPRPAAAAAAMARAAPQVDARPLPPRRRADLVILAGQAAGDTELVDRLISAEVTHLVVGVRDTTGVVGPLVSPGRSSCLRCADLHRRDRDPLWPAVAGQLARAHRGHIEPQDTALAGAIVGVAALQALAHLDGGAAAQTVDGTLELALPDCRVRRRSWPVHPDCCCRDIALRRTG
ncbi:MAG: thiamine biosynthesis protein ThiF [Pseudonocardiales bacterium]|nr:MAG: thiamine biosynthesis protein ThiF [Pseudonocardiales bacterium]